MKKQIIYLSLFLPAFLFALYLLMIIIGMAFSICGAEEGFYCAVYTKLPIVLVIGLIVTAAYWQKGKKLS